MNQRLRAAFTSSVGEGHHVGSFGQPMGKQFEILTLALQDFTFFGQAVMAHKNGISELFEGRGDVGHILDNAADNGVVYLSF